MRPKAAEGVLREFDIDLRRTLALLITSAVLISAMLLSATSARAQIGFGVSVSVGIAPPPLPVYEQPLCPGPGYIWTPGYWAWDPDAGYYWVPGTWVMAPFEGALWTPGYWGWNDGAYMWNVGFWGPVVGFYGGIDYGFGYTGEGYAGGYWNNGSFFYNQAVNNVNVTNIRNVYNKTVINNVSVSHVSYNGGTGGINARPTAAQLAAAHGRHDPPTAVQLQHARAAASNRSQWASVNHGVPAVAATRKPGALSGPGVVRASRAGGKFNPALEHAAAAAKNRPANARPGTTAKAARTRTPNPAGGGTRPLMTAHGRTAVPRTRSSERARTTTPSSRTETNRSAAARTAAPRSRTPVTSTRYSPTRTAPAARPHNSPARTVTPHPQARTESVPRTRNAGPARTMTPRAETRNPSSVPRTRSAGPARPAAPQAARPQRAPRLEPAAPRAVPRQRSAGPAAAPRRVAPQREAPARQAPPERKPHQQ
jgi:hypothetical protein